MGESTTWRGFTIRAEYKGDKAAPWKSENQPENYNWHTVTVRYQGRQATFDFWGSLMEPEVRKPADLRSAFECFLSDAISGAQSFEEFCSEFGYDTDSRSAERTWKACQRANAKATRLLGSRDIYDTINALNQVA